MMQAGKENSSGLHKIKAINQAKKTTTGSKPKQCGWCGQAKWCKKSECPAKDKNCRICGLKGHFDKVCRRSEGQQKPNSKAKPKAKVHEVISEDTEDEDVYFGQINVHRIDSDDEHLKPLWISTGYGETVHQVEAEIDSGAGCNVMPLYLYKAIFKDNELDRPTVRILAFGDTKVHVKGSCLVTIHTSEGLMQDRFQVTETKRHLIMGRRLSKRIKYLIFPEVTPPQLDQKPIEQPVLKITSTQDEKSEIKVPVVQYKAEKKEVTIEGKKWTLPVTEDQILQEFKDVLTVL